MPNPDTPEIKAWVNALNKAVGNVDEDTYFIGHSVGCQTILRYLEKVNKKVGGVFFVAGWFNLVNLENKEAEEIIKPWLKKKINLDRVRNLAKEFVAFFSDDDPWVPIHDADIFNKELGAKVIMEHGKGHFTEEDGVSAGTNINVLLDEILRVIK